MAVSSIKKKQQSYISVPSQIIASISQSSLDSLLQSPRNKKHLSIRALLRNPRFLIFLIFVFVAFFMLRAWFTFDPTTPISCSRASLSDGVSISEAGVDEGGEFWEQLDEMGYKPCLDFSEGYKKEGREIVKDRRKYLMVVVSGGMNQQRNQIVDGRILGAALVVPIPQVNVIWGDESEFANIFDLEHFKNVLEDDVRIVSSLPSTHLMTRPVEEKRIPLHVSPQWIRSQYLCRLRRDSVLLLRSLDSRLSKDLPSDLQKLRCKICPVNFGAWQQAH